MGDLLNFYIKFANQHAAIFSERICNAVIRHLQRESAGLIPEDSGLKNLWDEICVITQEGSFLFDEIESTIEGIVELKIAVAKPQRELLIALWLQTSNGKDWLDKQESHFSGDEELFYNSQDVIEHLREIVINKAINWSNKRLERYSDSQYEMDDAW